MAKRFSKFVFICVGGIVSLMLVAMIITSAFSLNPDQVRGLNVVEEWLLFRLAIYATVIAFWGQICKSLTRRKFKNSELTVIELSEAKKQREEDLVYLGSLWWKVALVFAFFEIVFIQQLGL